MTIYDLLRGTGNTVGQSTLAVSTAQARLVFHVGPWAAGTLYIKTVTGARTDGVIAARHAPTENTPHADWQDFPTPIAFTAAGWAAIDLTGINCLALLPSTTETGGTWIVEAWLAVQGDG